MKTGVLLILCLAALPLLAISQDSASLTSYAVGETNVIIHTTKFSPQLPGVTFINLHDNEQTSITATQNYLQACGGGTLVRISNQRERFISVCVSGQEYRFDPNRIYSPAGRKNTLLKLSGSTGNAVEAIVGQLAGELVRKHVINSRLVVAIHNNMDSSLSVISYLDDQSDGKHFGRVYVNSDMDPDDFILTTDFSLFQKIKAKNINVVWENSKQTPDDGSLSVYAGTHKIPYINIEAEHEHLDEQWQMLNALDDILKEYGQKKMGSPRRGTKGHEAKKRA